MMKIIKQGERMRIRQGRTRLWDVISLIIVVGALLSSGAYFISVSSVHAAQENVWTSGPPTLLEEATYRPRGASASLKSCTMQNIWIIGIATPQSKCIGDNGTVSIDSQFQYIKIGSDRQYYPLNNMGPGSRPVQLYASAASAYISRQGFGFGGHKGYLSIDSNIVQSLIPGVSGAGLRQYTYDYNPDFVLSDSNGQIPIGKAGDVSKNGRWLVVELYGKGFARIDLQNEYKTELFSNMKLPYYDGVVSWAEMAISDDGRYVALADRWVPMTVFEISNDCTRLISPNHPLSLDSYQVCPSISLQEAATVAQYQEHFSMAFDKSGHELVLHTGWVDGGLCGSEELGCDLLRTIRAAGYDTNAPRLDYLALGDSYSSGEGDTERDKLSNKKYYRQYTDNEEDNNLNQPREKCHISTRSYPYILSKGMSLGDLTNDSSTRWQSVACSGARVHDVYSERNYLGQAKGGDEVGRPRLEGYDSARLQADALNEFIPGRHEQLEFVSRYKPKVITLTMGGNDVGFGDRIKSCVWVGTCSEATELGKPDFAKMIRAQYDDLKTLYETLYDASGRQTKVYVIGYPQFINGEVHAPCGLNVGRLNEDEREMVHASVSYINNVIQQAAKAAGVKYINIEDSLEGGRLCDKSQAYMTGISSVGGSELQESFHPNAKGNNKIALKIWEEVNHESLLDYDICPDNEENTCPDKAATKDTIIIPSYFQVTEPAYATNYASDMTSGRATKDTPINVVRTSYSFSPGSTVELTLFSDPTNLGHYIAKSDGSLDVDVQIPGSVPSGYHTLVVDGATYSGEPIRYEQIVLVQGGDPSDIDENGISDSQQACGPFMKAGETDIDFDGVDDACDPYISEKPEIYRWRNGYAERTYSNNPEYESKIYIERNIWASNLTNVNDDYDPDGDGWAVVGVSNERQIAMLDMESVDFEQLGSGTSSDPYRPIVYIHPNSQQCKAFRPTSLGRVVINESRTLSVAEISNSKCPQKLPDNSNPPAPESSPPMHEVLLSKLITGLQTIKTQLSGFIIKVVVQLNNFLSSLRRW